MTCPGMVLITSSVSNFAVALRCFGLLLRGWGITLASFRYAAIQGEAFAEFNQGCENLAIVTDHKPPLRSSATALRLDEEIALSSTKVTILLPLFERAIIAPNKLMAVSIKTSQEENHDRMPFTLTFHPHEHAVESIIVKKLIVYFKIILILEQTIHNLY